MPSPAEESIELRTSPAERLDRIMLGDENDREHFPGVLYRKGEAPEGDKPPEGSVVITGIVRTFGFHRERLEASRSEIEKLIREVVTDDFLNDRGNGASFLNLCVDRKGVQWGEHASMEILLCLAMGLQIAGYCLPREFWSVLPGGMPFIWFKDLHK
jgi:hypothetical protein